jgi:transposase
MKIIFATDENQMHTDQSKTESHAEAQRRREIKDMTFPTNGGRGDGRVFCPERSAPMARKYFTKAFKDEACNLVLEQQYEIAVAGKQLGIGEQTLRYWLVQRGWKGPKVVGLESEESDDPKILRSRIRDLEQRVRRAEMEREILKKATAYFASQDL